METRQGYVERITYRNEENGYTVLTLTQDDGEELCLVGLFPSVSEGEYISAEGEMTVHPAYGPQLKVTKYEFIAPQDELATERYLASGAVKGIGPKLAKRIVAQFGSDTFRILEEEPERLSEVKGISEHAAMNIAMQIIEKREVRNAVLFLQQYNISLNMAAKIYRFYGDRLYTILRENPYRLAEDIQGIGFKASDDIAKQMNIKEDSEFRVRAAILYILSNAAQSGHTYLPKDLLFSQTEGLLNLIISDFDHLLEGLLVDKKISMVKDGDETRVYLRSLHRMERNTAILLKDLNISEENFREAKALNDVLKAENQLGVNLNDEQRKAVLTAARSGITILTGGPGTGKTTTINVLIRYFINQGLDLLLAAPTGRAAKRMTEATGYEAQTIHRLLEVSGNPEDRDSRLVFQRNDDRPLEADVIIIDEMSMVDITLMHALLQATVPGMRLVFVGDVDQLPSVGPGEVLKSLITSGCFPVVELKQIYRQSQDSDIIVNAHRINAGEIVEPKFSKDFLFVKRDDAGTIIGATITLLKEKLPKYIHADMMDLQVLTPMRKGVLGVEMLNRELQEAFNPKSDSKKEKESGDRIFREGDKVMQTKNDYYMNWSKKTGNVTTEGMGIFNGDIGFIRSVNHFTSTLTIEFDDGKFVEYPFASLDELEHAYAITIHKSQGSEYPAVILPLYYGSEKLLTRRLLYTGVTRAKSCVVIVGRYETFVHMIENNDIERRFTGLKGMIQDVYNPY